MHILQVIGIILEIIILFNFIIIVHELGHYWAARWRGLKVEKFQIWFGKPIWSKKINGVQWGLGWIPAGGFVALPQMAPMEMIEGKNEDGPLPPIKPLDKIIVAAAGPLFSFALAFVFALVVWKIGHPVSLMQKSTTIGFLGEKLPAGAEKLQVGDVIKRVDARPVDSWRGMNDSVQWNVISSQGDTIPFDIERNGQPLRIEVQAPAIAQPALAGDGMMTKLKAVISGFFTRPGFREIGLSPAYFPMVGKLLPHSPAEKAGLKPSDVVVSLNGAKVLHPAQISDFIKQNQKQEIKLGVVRGDFEKNKAKIVEIPVTPEIPTNRKEGEMIGVEWDNAGLSQIDHPSPTKQIQSATMTMYNTLSSVASPKSSISARHLSGPVGIMRVYYILFEDKEGWRRAFWFSVLLNINLAILNLLPLPVLDGGHILMAVIEWIRRRPINVRLLEFVQAGCAIFLFGFMIYLTGFDVRDIFGGGKEAADPSQAPPIFAPAKP